MWSSEGPEISLFSSGYNADFNRRFTPGIFTPDTYSDAGVDWLYDRDTDPVLDGEDVKDGHLWRNSGGTIKIYYKGFWLTWGRNYASRSTGTTSSSYFRYILDSGNWPSTANSNQSHYLLPSFSI